MIIAFVFFVIFFKVFLILIFQVSKSQSIKTGFKLFFKTAFVVDIIENAGIMADEMVNRGYSIISSGTDNHSMLIDLRSKNVTGKEAENALGKADITVNKNMVPFDTESPFITSGIRLGTAAITTRGVNKEETKEIVELIDETIVNYDNDTKLKEIRTKVNNLMSNKPLFKW